MDTLTVNLGARSYPIHVGSGILHDLGAFLQRQRFSPGRVGLVTDSHVGRHYREPVVGRLRAAGFQPVVIEIPAGEEHKNLAWLTFLYDKLVDERLERNAPLLALGGGMIGDLTGFAAATFRRGVPFVQIPTSLLAQVDASVGGKTAVNHPSGKNLIGAFYQPRLVVIDVETLKTLSRREFLSGVAEVIKYGAILSPELFGLLEEELPALLGQKPGLLTSIVKTCCQLKALVVEEDETEGDYRAILNFGHTLGHAIESATDYKRFLHGEAVAMGMVFAVRLSQQRKLCRPAVRDRVIRLIRAAGLPVETPDDLAREHLRIGMQADKKVTAGKIKFVCLEDIGRTRFAFLGTDEIVGHLYPGRGRRGSRPPLQS